MSRKTPSAVKQTLPGSAQTTVEQTCPGAAQAVVKQTRQWQHSLLENRHVHGQKNCCRTDTLWRSRNTFPLLWACSTYWRKVWAVVNPRLDLCKHNNTLCGDSTISKPYWTAFNKMSTTCEWVRLFILDKSSLHIVAWDLDVKKSQLWQEWMMSNPVTQ